MSSLDANLLFRLLPFQRATPLLTVGGGIMAQRGKLPVQLRGERFYETNAGVGLQYTPAKLVSLRTMLEYHQPFTDNVDGRVAGRFNDYYLRATLGAVLNVGRFTPPKPKSVRPVGKKP